MLRYRIKSQKAKHTIVNFFAEYASTNDVYTKNIINRQNIISVNISQLIPKAQRLQSLYLIYQQSGTTFTNRSIYFYAFVAAVRSSKQDAKKKCLNSA